MQHTGITHVLRVRSVAGRLGVSVPTVWRWARERSDFPKAVRLGDATTGWISAEIETFIEQRAAKREGAA